MLLAPDADDEGDDGDDELSHAAGLSCKLECANGLDAVESRKPNSRVAGSANGFWNHWRDDYGSECRRLPGGDYEGARMKTTLKVCSVVLVLTPATILCAQASKWPVIRPLEGKKVFINPGKNNTDTPFMAFIKDSDGVPVYKLECHNGNYEGESEMNFSGDFQCALFAVKGTTRTSGNLLAADTKNELSTDWGNRGRMRAAQFRGECLKFTEYSTNRRFKLRGMLLTLRFADVKWGPRKDQQGEPVLAGFTFLVKVVPDESAQSSRTELPAGPKPRSDCYP